MLDVTTDDALAMIASGTIRDGKTIMLLQHAALHLFPRSGGRTKAEHITRG